MEPKQRKDIVKLLKSAGLMDVGKAALGAGGKALPVIGNVLSAGSGISNLAQGNLGSAALDFAGMLPGVGNTIQLMRAGHEVGKMLTPSQQPAQQPAQQMPPNYQKMAAPLVGCDKDSLYQRGCAFEAGVETFCKEAGFDDADKKAMYRLMLAKQAGNEAAAGNTTAVPVSEQEMANSRGDPGGPADQPGGGSISGISKWWNTAPTPADQRIRNDTGWGTTAGKFFNMVSPLALAVNGTRWAVRKGTDEWAAGEQQAVDAKNKIQQDNDDEIMRVHNPEGYQSMLRGRRAALLTRQKDKQDTILSIRSEQRASMLASRAQARADRQALSGKPAGSFGSAPNLGMPAMPAATGGRMPTPETQAQAQANPAAPHNGGYFSNSSPDGSIKATTMPSVPAPAAPPSPAPGGSVAPPAAPAPSASGTAPAAK